MAKRKWVRHRHHRLPPLASWFDLRTTADFAFVLHGLHYLKDDGVMAIILPHGGLFRSAKGIESLSSHDRASGRAAVREKRTLECIIVDSNT